MRYHFVSNRRGIFYRRSNGTRQRESYFANSINDSEGRLPNHFPTRLFQSRFGGFGINSDECILPRARPCTFAPMETWNTCQYLLSRIRERGEGAKLAREFAKSDRETVWPFRRHSKVELPRF